MHKRFFSAIISLGRTTARKGLSLKGNMGRKKRGYQIGEGKCSNCCLSGRGVQLSRCGKDGGEGGEAPFTSNGRPAVPRAAWSASARTGRCKKIAVSQKDFSNFFVSYVPRYSQFSCGFRRASEGVPPPTPPPLRFL